MNGVAAALKPGTQGEATEANGSTPVVEEAGATLFTELVSTHWDWQRSRRHGGPDGTTAKKAYEEKLAEFRKKVGEINHVYWSTRGASAVALTVEHKSEGTLLRERDDVLRLHRVTDWVTRDAPGVAEVLHECDALAIRVSEILRGPSERIAMRWIFCVQEHLLGFFERADGKSPSAAEVRELVDNSRAELKRIEAYYLHAACQHGRIVYITGMLIGVGLIVAVASIVASALWLFAAFEGDYASDLGILFLCLASGALGALVSVMYRLREKGSFTVDVEVGRPLVRKLGVFRSVVGATFGLLVYALLASGVLVVSTDPGADQEYLYFAVAAFFAGFSERFVHVLVSDAESKLARPESEPAPAAEKQPA